MKKHDVVSIMFFSFVIGGGLLSAVIIVYGIFFYHPEGWQERIIQLVQFFGGTGGLMLFIKQFQKIIDQRINAGYYDDEREIVSYISGELNDYIEKRSANIEIIDDGRLYPQVAMSACLSFLLSFLRKRNSVADYEISVFWNTTEPDILCYIDSTGRNTASSNEYRKDDPMYYRNKNYEVVKYLEDETMSMSYSVDIVHYKDNVNYKNATSRQKARIKNQIFHRFSLNPHVLVITCNKPNVFKKSDEELKKVIRTFGLLLNSELILKAKFCCNKAMGCDNCEK